MSSDLWGLTLDSAPVLTGRLYFAPVDGTDRAILLSDVYDGIAGGKTFSGGTGSGENLTIRSTEHATKGKVIIDTNALVVDGVNDRIGIGTTTPAVGVDCHAAIPGIQMTSTAAATADRKSWRFAVEGDPTVLLVRAIKDDNSSSNVQARFIGNATGQVANFRVGDFSVPQHNLDVDNTNGRVFLHLPTSAPADADIQNQQVCFYLDDTTSDIRAKWKKADGTVEDALVANG